MKLPCLLFLLLVSSQETLLTALRKLLLPWPSSSREICAGRLLISQLDLARFPVEKGETRVSKHFPSVGSIYGTPPPLLPGICLISDVQHSVRQRLTLPASVLSDVASSLCSTLRLGSHSFSLLPNISTSVHPPHPPGPKQIPSGDFWLQAGCLLSLPAGSIC